MENTRKRSLARRLAVAFGWTAGGVLGLAALMVGYYQFDDALTPEARAVLENPPKVGAAGDDNGYIAMLGMSAPSGEDQMAWGKKHLDALRVQDIPGFKADETWNHLTKVHLSAPLSARWCAPGKNCAKAYQAKRAELAKLVAANRELLDRYEVVRAKPVFDEAYVPALLSSNFPNYGSLSTAQHLSRAVIFAKVSSGDVRSALDDMAKEIAFHQRAAAGARTLIGNMIALRLVGNDALALSELMHSQRQAMAPHAARIGKLLRQIDGQLGVGPMFESERFYITNLYKDPDVRYFDSTNDRWLLMLYRPNMTVNEIVAEWREQLTVLSAPPQSFDEGKRKLLEARARHSRKSWLDWVRNPVGRLFIDQGLAAYEDYSGRVHDTTALVRLVMVQAALLERRAEKAQDIATILAADGGKRFADPYTGKPFELDADTRKVSFLARGKGGWTEDVATKERRVAITP